MRSIKTIHVVSCHAEGEVGDVIVGGVTPPPGETIWEQSRWIAEDNSLRQFVLNEPRGGVFRHVNLLVPPKHPKAQMGWIIMEPEDTPPMSGSNSMCVATVLLETGIIPMQEPETRVTLEAPGGLIEVRAQCHDGKVERVTIENVPSFVAQRDVVLDVDGYGSVRVDTAFGGDSFVMVKAEDLGLEIAPEKATELVAAGVAMTKAANDQLGFHHPTNPDWRHISFCQIYGPTSEKDGCLAGPNTVVIQPGKLDRCPTGTGVSARLALLHDQGVLKEGDKFLSSSVLGSEFEGQILRTTQIKGAKGQETAAIIPAITGRAWITGTHQYHLDPSDPWPHGYRITDTWPLKK